MKNTTMVSISHYRLEPLFCISLDWKSTRSLGLSNCSIKVILPGMKSFLRALHFFTYPISFPVKLHYSFLLLQAKLGLGVVYMQAPESAGSSMQTWFGVRPAFAMAYMTSVGGGHNSFGEGTSIGGGLELGYTYCPAKSNVYDHRSIVHFFGLAAKFIVTF